MNPWGPYLPRIDQRGSVWFVRAIGTAAAERAVVEERAARLAARGNVLRQQRRYGEALASYEQAIALAPGYAEAFNSRGSVLGEVGRLDAAIASFEQAIALKPSYVDALYNRGIALQSLRRFEEALASFDRCAAFAPSSADVFNSRGNVLGELGRLDAAIASFEHAIALKGDYADAFFGRGIALQQLERFEEALASFDRAAAARPDNAAAFTNRGNVLQELRRFEEALASYDKAISLRPQYAEAYYNRALALTQLGRFEEALASYDKAIAIKPDYPAALNNRGHLLKDEGRQAEAIASFERALALKPDYADAKLALCMAQLPILYDNEAEIAAQRTAYRESLERLRDDVERRSMPREWAKAVGSTQPFLLAYQGYSDRDIARLYGPLMCQIMADRYPAAAPAPAPRPNERVRLGIVSGFFWQHSVWKIPLRGWLSQIDRRRFQVFGYHTAVKQDPATREAASLCDRFVQGPLSMERWRDAILRDALHVIIHPDIGMNAVSAQLAAQRLAAVQCTSWGHPDTSGFPTIDYYLSSELMEPPEGQDHYTERLVLLPNLSIYYEPPDLQPASLARADLGLRTSATVFWCGQSLFKYLPQFDVVFARIAQEAPDCQFAFIRYGQGTYLDEKFMRRLDRAFATVGLNAADHCVLLPRLDPHRFVAAIGLCDIVLDSIGWSGCNSTLEGLHHDLPIVTMTGSLMRGRHTMAILKRMGVEETITETTEDYVSAAVRLARDPAWRWKVKTKISQNKHRLYRDAACVSALEKFLESVVHRATP